MEKIDMGGHGGGGGRSGRGGGGGAGGAGPSVSPEVQEILDSWPVKNVTPDKAAEVLAYAATQKTFGNKFIDATTEKFGVSDGFADHVAKHMKEKRASELSYIKESGMTAKERQVRSILQATKGQRFGGNKTLGNR